MVFMLCCIFVDGVCACREVARLTVCPAAEAHPSLPHLQVHPGCHPALAATLPVLPVTLPPGMSPCLPPLCIALCLPALTLQTFASGLLLLFTTLLCLFSLVMVCLILSDWLYHSHRSHQAPDRSCPIVGLAELTDSLMASCA